MSTRLEFVVLCDGCGSRVVSKHSLHEAKDLARCVSWTLLNNDAAYCEVCRPPLFTLPARPDVDWPDLESMA